MKIFKIILVLVLLFSVSFGVCGDSDITDWYVVGGTKSDITWQPKTLESWFEHLTLDEQIVIYNWWKNKSVDWKKNAFKADEIKGVPYKESGNYKRLITSYSEFFMDFGNFGIMHVEILNLKPKEIDDEKDKIEKLINIRNIETLSIRDNNIFITVHISGEDSINKLREIEDKLLNHGFTYGK